MITVIPAAGRSSRYFGKKPKWLRTLPDGKLMIESAVEGLVNNSDRTILITTQDIERDYKVTTLFEQIFGSRIEIIVLENSTSSAVETVVEGLAKAKVKLDEYLIIKDSDNIVGIESIDTSQSFSVGVDISTNNIGNLGAKSFFKRNEEGVITDFVEKKIISQYISVGTHGFSSVSTFLDYASLLFNNSPQNANEHYISNVIALMLYDGVSIKYVEAAKYLDLGTQREWEALRKSKATYFVDYDGTLVKNAGKYGSHRWIDEDVAIESNILVLKDLFDKGAQIVVTTSRSKDFEEDIEKFLAGWGIFPYQIVTGLNHSQRVIINDYADTNVYPSATAINLPRNGRLDEYFV